MKANNRTVNLSIIYSFAVIVSFVLILTKGVLIAPDSKSYLVAWECISNGALDGWRTPVYPAYLGIMQLLFGQGHFLTAAVIGQFLVFLISLYYLYKAACFLFPSERWSLACALLYALLVFFSKWNNFILTESLSMSFNVLLVYTLFSLFDKKKDTYLIGSTVIMLVLLFLRPSFIYLLPIFIVTLVIMYCQNRSNKKIIFGGLLAMAFVFLCYNVYMMKFKQEKGIYATSVVGLYNQYYLSRMYGVIDPSVIGNKSLRDYVRHSISVNGKEFMTDEGTGFIYPETSHIFDNYKLPLIQEVVSRSIKLHKGHYVYRTLLYFAQPVTDLMHGNRIAANGFKTIYYLFLLTYSFILIYYIVRRRAIPLLSSTLYMIGVSNLIVSVVGAMGGFGRLIMPSVCIYVLMLTQIALIMRKKANNLK